MAIALVIFDLDGTLFDTRQDIAAAVNSARQQTGLPPLPLEGITAMVGEGIRVLAERAFHGTGVDLDAATTRIMDYYAAHPADRSRLYDGVRETLPQIAALKTIVSNKPKTLVDALLDTHGIASSFAHVAGGDSYPRRKPDPMAVEFLVSRFGIPAEQMLVVGDHFPDIQMGRRSGAKTVYCNYGFFGNDETGADFTIDRFAEVLPVLQRLG